MNWIKRNLIFCVLLLIAVGLLGFAGFQIVQKQAADEEVTTTWKTDSAKLKELHELAIFPSSQNVKAIQQDQRRIREFIESSRKLFQPIPPVQASKASELRPALDRLLSDLNVRARASQVQVPTNYAFSFTAQKALVTYANGGIGPIAQQLAEVEKICDVLFAARVNRLESIQRAKVTDDDFGGQAVATDYVTLTNSLSPMGTLKPYRLEFRCFSSELAAVLNGLAESPHGFIVKTVDMQPAQMEYMNFATRPPPFTPFTPITPLPPPPPRIPGQRLLPGQPRPRLLPGAGVAPGVPAAPKAGVVASGLKNYLNERPLRVSLLVQLIN